MSVTEAGDRMKSDWPHWRCALRGLFPVTEVRWFMIYFPITPSLLCALGPPVNNHYLPSHIYRRSFHSHSVLCWDKLGRGFHNYEYSLFVSLVIGTREGTAGRLKAMNDRAPVVLVLVGGWQDLHTWASTADGESWGLHNSSLSRMSPHLTESSGSPLFAYECEMWETRGGKYVLLPDPRPGV